MKELEIIGKYLEFSLFIATKRGPTHDYIKERAEDIVNYCRTRPELINLLSTHYGIDEYNKLYPKRGLVQRVKNMLRTKQGISIPYNVWKYTTELTKRIWHSRKTNRAKFRMAVVILELLAKDWNQFTHEDIGEDFEDLELALLKLAQASKDAAQK